MTHQPEPKLAAAASPKRRGSLRLTGPNALTNEFLKQVEAPLRAVARHPYFTRFLEEASLAQIRKGLLGFYPVVEAFPRYMAAMLARIEPSSAPRAMEARSWLMKNISIEELHREWWIDLGGPLGLTPTDFFDYQPGAKMEAQSHYLFHVAHAAPLGEGLAAVNYAVEGATGIWTREMSHALRKRLSVFGIELESRAARWLDAHAGYDDAHPIEALELIKVFCTDGRAMERAGRAAVRSLEYYALALDDALEA